MKEGAEMCEHESACAIKLMQEKELELAHVQNAYHRMKKEVDFLVLDICNK